MPKQVQVKPFSPQSTGDDHLTPGAAVFQAAYSLSLLWPGKRESSATPIAPGPY